MKFTKNHEAIAVTASITVMIVWGVVIFYPEREPVKESAPIINTGVARYEDRQQILTC